MPEVEKTSDARVTIRGIGEFTVGDRADVTADEAAYLCDERGDFERVANIEAKNESVKEALVSDADGTDDSTDDKSGDYPAADDTSDAHWQSIASAVRDGVYDDSLDTVAEHDHRSSVLDAVGERRAEIED